MKRVAIALTTVAMVSIVFLTGRRAEASPPTHAIGARTAAIHTVGVRYGGYYAPRHGYYRGHPYPYHYYPRARYSYRVPVYRDYYSPYYYDGGCYRPYGRYYPYSPYGVSVYGGHFGLSIGF